MDLEKGQPVCTSGMSLIGRKIPLGREYWLSEALKSSDPTQKKNTKKKIINFVENPT